MYKPLCQVFAKSIDGSMTAILEKAELRKEPSYKCYYSIGSRESQGSSLMDPTVTRLMTSVNHVIWAMRFVLITHERRSSDDLFALPVSSDSPRGVYGDYYETETY
ncbi:hypothetical protein KXD40_005431 [Peronospora effusa]|uniref:Uncharacterized protein n=1 Tax=Peronospora effusa TaxID=542832 RepID=A0A3M6VND8_9STRA|nr:hypothetical protein DD238_000559 [Peronospora effusa]UIZ27284.1 hypothetical protein KXD40_005431 [Peronospora effusa]